MCGVGVASSGSSGGDGGSATVDAGGEAIMPKLSKASKLPKVSNSCYEVCQRLVTCGRATKVL